MYIFIVALPHSTQYENILLTTLGAVKTQKSVSMPKIQYCLIMQILL